LEQLWLELWRNWGKLSPKACSFPAVAELGKAAKIPDASKLPTSPCDSVTSNAIQPNSLDPDRDDTSRDQLSPPIAPLLNTDTHPLS
jgi:hypothetical protein